MPGRYDNINNVINNSDLYYDIFESKNISYIEHLPTQIFRPVTEVIRLGVLKTSHIWSSGDKLHALSTKYYDDPRYWWLISWFNQKPTEQHIKIGEIIYVALPLNKILSYYYGE